MVYDCDLSRSWENRVTNESIFLGAYSAAGMQGMMNSTFAARVSAVKKMVEKVGGKLGTLHIYRVLSMSLRMSRSMIMKPLLVYMQL